MSKAERSDEPRTGGSVFFLKSTRWLGQEVKTGHQFLPSSFYREIIGQKFVTPFIKLHMLPGRNDRKEEFGVDDIFPDKGVLEVGQLNHPFVIRWIRLDSYGWPEFERSGERIDDG